jgi:hypothetical protein
VLPYFEKGIHYELLLSCLSSLSICKYNAVLSMFCMCGKDPWIKKFFNTETEASRIGVAKEATEDGTAQRYAGMFACLYLFAFEVVSMRHT